MTSAETAANLLPGEKKRLCELRPGDGGGYPNDPSGVEDSADDCRLGDKRHQAGKASKCRHLRDMSLRPPGSEANVGTL